MGRHVIPGYWESPKILGLDALRGARDAEFLHAKLECGRFEAQALGRTAFAADAPTDGFQGFKSA